MALEEKKIQKILYLYSLFLKEKKFSFLTKKLQSLTNEEKAWPWEPASGLSQRLTVSADRRLLVEVTTVDPCLAPPARSNRNLRRSSSAMILFNCLPETTAET